MSAHMTAWRFSACPSMRQLCTPGTFSALVMYLVGMAGRTTPGLAVAPAVLAAAAGTAAASRAAATAPASAATRIRETRFPIASLLIASIPVLPVSGKAQWCGQEFNDRFGSSAYPQYLSTSKSHSLTQG